MHIMHTYISTLTNACVLPTYADNKEKVQKSGSTLGFNGPGKELFLWGLPFYNG